MPRAIDSASGHRAPPPALNEARRAIPWHFVGIAVYSVLGYYSHNIGEIAFAEVSTLGGLVLAVALVLYILVFSLDRNSQRAALYSSAVLLTILFYGHLSHAVPGLLGSRIPHKVLIPSFAAICLGTAYFFGRSRTRLGNATIILNVVVAALLVVPVWTVAAYQFNSAQQSADALNSPVPGLTKPHSPPSVFFIILDRYAANQTLVENYAFDNSEFLNFLRERGFHVAEKSTANYIRTVHSLASTFQMDYLDSIAAQAGAASSDYSPLIHALKSRHRVLATFEALGYRYAHFGSWWDPTRTHHFADEIVNTAGRAPVAEAWSEYLRGTIFYAIAPGISRALNINRIGDLGLRDRWEEQCERVPYQFSRLAEAHRVTEPTFVFAHILVPHYPYVFDASGRCMKPDESDQLPVRQKYIGQVRYVNKELMTLVDTLQAMERPPVILIQADEGPFPVRYPDENKIDWKQATDEDLQEKFRILNAAYFPGKPSKQRYDSISSVNTFRVVFNELFAAGLPLLPDRSFAIPDLQHLYDFYEVTNIVK